MASDRTYLYWDACVFSSYVGEHPDRADTILEVWEQVARQHPRKAIITSSLSILEVAFASGDGSGVRDPERERQIDALWREPTIYVADASQDLMYLARGLMRAARDKGWSLKPADALHLATAQWINQKIGYVQEVHTYDDKWVKMSELVDGLKICEPYVAQPRLIRDSGESKGESEGDSSQG